MPLEDPKPQTHLDGQRLTQPVGAVLSHGVHGPEKSDALQSVSSLFCELTLSSPGGCWPVSWLLMRNSSSVHWGHSITELAGHMSPSVPVAVAGKRPCRPEARERLKVSSLSSNALLMSWLENHPVKGRLLI